MILSPRRRRIVLLAGSLDDLRLGVRGHLRTQSGFVPGVKVPCSACGGHEVRSPLLGVIGQVRGSGFVVDRFRRRSKCERCQGGGWLMLDRMDERLEPVGSVELGTTPARTVSKPCDRCDRRGVYRGERCWVCDGTGVREWSPFELRVELVADPDVAAIDRAIIRRDEAGDYAALELALASLLAVDRDAWRAWSGRYVHSLNGAVLDEAGVERGWEFVDARMPDPVRVPGEVRRNEREQRMSLVRAKGRHKDPKARAARNREIRRLFNDEGVSREELMRRFNLRRSQLYDVLASE